MLSAKRVTASRWSWSGTMWPGGEGGGFVGNERSVTAAGVLAVLGTILFVGTIAWMAAIWSHLGRGDSVLA